METTLRLINAAWPWLGPLLLGLVLVALWVTVRPILEEILGMEAEEED